MQFFKPLDSSQFPGNLSLIGTSINSLFTDLLYKDYYFESDSVDHSRFQSMTLQYNQALEFEIFNGSGLKVVINPGATSTTEIPICFYSYYPHKKYFPKFKLSTFNLSFEEVFSYLLQKIGANKVDIFKCSLDSFESGPDKIGNFVAKINLNYNPSITIVVPTHAAENERLLNVLYQLESKYIKINLN